MKRNRSAIAGTSVVIIGPPLVVLLLQLPLINQLEYADAWFYSAYAWTPRHHFATFDWNYFSVRFPAILAIGIFERLFGVHEGYVVLRYLLAVASGAALYLCVRRFSTAAIAAATVGLLYLNPFFSRMLLWDYTGFLVVSAGIVGFALWWWSASRRARWSVLPGTAFAVAVFSNVIFVTALFVLAAVEFAAAVRSGRGALIHLTRRIAVSTFSALGVLIIGYVSYLRFSAVSPDDLIRPTIDFLLSNEENAGLYKRPTSDWLLHEFRIWAPIVTSVALVAVLRRGVLGTDLPARIAQVCIGYTAFLWLYRLAVTSSVIETWWAYNIVVVVTAPAIGVLLHGLAQRWPSDKRPTLLVVGVTLLAAAAIRTFDGESGDAYRSISDRPAFLFALVALAIGASAGLTLKSIAVRASMLVIVIGVLSLTLWAPSIFDGRGATGEFVQNADLDWDAYQGANDFVDIFRRYDAPGSYVYTWYPDPAGPDGIAWTTLPQYGRTVHVVGLPATMNTLEPLGRARLIGRDAAYVLALSEHQADLRGAQGALTKAGFRSEQVGAGTVADKRLRYVVLRLTAKPPA